MEPFILAASSTVGAFAALALKRGSKGSYPPTSSPNELQRRIVSQAMNRIYDYEREGKINEDERERLLSMYRQELSSLENARHPITLYENSEFNAIKENLVAVLDQRVAQINSRLDDLSNRISTSPQTKALQQERKEEKHPERPKSLHLATLEEGSDSPESDAGLDEIKKQIMQTLSRLEQAEVE